MNLMQDLEVTAFIVKRSYFHKTLQIQSIVNDRVGQTHVTASLPNNHNYRKQLAMLGAKKSGGSLRDHSLQGFKQETQ